jgi:hypothetical protein
MKCRQRTFSCVRKLSTTTCEWSALCLLASYALPVDKVCRSAMAAFIAWMSCLMTPAHCVAPQHCRRVLNVLKDRACTCELVYLSGRVIKHAGPLCELGKLAELL